MRVTTKSPEETENAGYRLGNLLKKGDIVCFYGDLGSGKTTMIKGIAAALGIEKRDITSASFTIIAEYNQGSCPLKHIDLYRLDHGADIENAGVWDSINRDSVAVIEWAGKMEDILPEAIRITITDKGDMTREITIEGIDEKDWDHM